MEFKLTKKEYLGRPSYRFFKHNKTGEMLKIETTKEEYDSVEQQNEQPVRRGYTWVYSVGDVIKVDNPNGDLENGQYCDFEDGYFVFVYNDKTQKYICEKVSKDKIINDTLIWQ